MALRKATIVWFFVCIMFFSLFTLWWPKEDFSEDEDRTLAPSPSFSYKGLLDASFITDSESFLKDHIVFRSNMLSFKTSVLAFSGKRMINNIILSNGKLIKNITVDNGKIASENTEAIKAFLSNHKTAHINMMIVPTAQEVYQEKNPAFLDTFPQNDYIQYIYNELDCTKSDAYTTLLSAKEEYIFYNTHSNWTSLGAYAGYNALAKELGYKPATIDTFDIEHASNNFLGNIYSKILYKDALKDHIDLYHYTGDVSIEVKKYTYKNTQTYQSIYFYDYLQENNEDKIFLGEDVPVVKITSSNKNGKKLLIFKDDTANALMQFLPIHYSEIVLVDLEYLNRPLSDYIDIRDYPQIQFLYSIETILSDVSIKKVETF